MKILLIFVLMVIVLWVVLEVWSVFQNKENSNIEFLNKEHTDILKGYAILGVLVGHVGQYSNVNGIEYPAGVGVSLFLILSGYGLAMSYSKNGLAHYWTKKIQRVWIPYVFAQLVDMLILTQKRDIGTIVLDFTFIKPMHPFGWYLRYLAVCYIIFFLVFLFIKNIRLLTASIFLCFFIWFLIRSLVIIDATPFLQARQMLAFPCGVLIGLNKNKILSTLGGGVFEEKNDRIFNNYHFDIYLWYSSHESWGWITTHYI